MHVNRIQRRQPAWLGMACLPIVLVCFICSPSDRLYAQVSLADDIIMAAQGKENAERSEQRRQRRLSD